MLHLLIDTCVWIDLAKDPRQLPTLSCLETLVSDGQVALIVPQTVVDEFARNRDRIIKEGSQSLSALFKQVKETVERYGAAETRTEVIAGIDDVDHRVAVLREIVGETCSQIEALFASFPIEPTSEAIKARAADRAIQGLAPFHRPKNAIGDALLIEHYSAASDEVILPDRSGFVSHNTRDFSDPGGDNRRPHPDLAGLFSETSVYAINLAELMGEFAPEVLEEVRFETEWSMESRRLPEIAEAIDLCFDQVWYNRHCGLRHRVETGKMRVVPDSDYPKGRYPQDLMSETTWRGALAAAARVEARRAELLGPWSDFEWGMINGKLSALRWVLGDEWDMLDT